MAALTAGMQAQLAARGAAVVGIGVDIAHTPRLLGLHARHGERFLRKVLHPSEQVEFERRAARCESRGAEFLASRWSAKEAAYKALGGAVPGSGGVRPAFPELVVCSDEAPGGGGGVALRLEGAARSLADKAGVTTTLLSLSHEEDYAVAFVITLSEHPAEGGGP